MAEVAAVSSLSILLKADMVKNEPNLYIFLFLFNSRGDSSFF